MSFGMLSQNGRQPEEEHYSTKFVRNKKKLSIPVTNSMYMM
jgi:hypothetical protein